MRGFGLGGDRDIGPIAGSTQSNRSPIPREAPVMNKVFPSSDVSSPFIEKSFDAAFASGECRRSLKTLASMCASKSSKHRELWN
jgi:hypothetical protein